MHLHSFLPVRLSFTVFITCLVTVTRLRSGTSAGFWLGGSMPPCRVSERKFLKFDYEMVHSEVYLNKCGQQSAVLYTYLP